MLNCRGRNTVRFIKKMEEQDNLAGPQPPDVHNRLIASLPATRKFVLGERTRVDSSAPRRHRHIDPHPAPARFTAKLRALTWIMGAQRWFSAHRGDLDRNRLDTRDRVFEVSE
jgi:hypothetical protein